MSPPERLEKKRTFRREKCLDIEVLVLSLTGTGQNTHTPRCASVLHGRPTTGIDLRTHKPPVDSEGLSGLQKTKTSGPTDTPRGKLGTTPSTLDFDIEPGKLRGLEDGPVSHGVYRRRTTIPVNPSLRMTPRMDVGTGRTQGRQDFASFLESTSPLEHLVDDTRYPYLRKHSVKKRGEVLILISVQRDGKPDPWCKRIREGPSTTQVDGLQDSRTVGLTQQVVEEDGRSRDGRTRPHQTTGYTFPS